MSINKILIFSFLLLLIPSASAVNRIVGNWTFDENTGSISYDTSGLNNNGTNYNLSWTTGVQNSALNYNGTYSYVNVGNSPTLNFTTAMTFSTWINTSNTKAVQFVGGKGNTGVNGWFMAVANGNTIQFRAQNGTTTNVAEAIYPTGKWAHIVGTLNGTYFSVFVNGIEGTRIPFTGTISQTGLNNTLIGAIEGAGMTAARYFNGRIDQVKLYNYSLNQSEINQLIKDYPRVLGWNNVSFDDSVEFQTIRGKTVKFNYSVPNESTYIWWADGVVQGSTTNLMNYVFSSTGTHYINVSTPVSGIFNNWTVQVFAYNLEALTPINGSTQTNPVTFTWREWETDLPHTLTIASDPQFINNVSISTIMSGSDENFTTTISGLTEGVQYFWRVKNNSGFYTNIMNFTLVSGATTPGRFNLSVWDETNLTFPILNYTAQFYNSTTVTTRTTTTGWVNLSSDEIASGEYLIIVTPSGTFNNYFPRMVLSTSPTNVTMYVPNSTSPNTVDLISFSLLDVTGFFPYQTSTISVYKGGLLMDKSYFSQDGTHSVYLLQGTNYNINVQNGAYLFSGNNFVPYASGSSTITINDFSVNTTGINPFVYNITYDTNEITLRWNDVGGLLSSLNFTFNKGDPMVVECQLTTSVRVGQSVCAIDTTHVYHFIFSAALTDGTYRNASFLIDLTYGKRKTSTGTSTIDGSPIGTGFKWDYGTWTTPDWVYNYASLLLIILLAGSFGGYHSGLGGIVVVAFSILLEAWGLFRPLGDTVDPDNFITMGITGGIGILVILYYLQHKDRGG